MPLRAVLRALLATALLLCAAVPPAWAHAQLLATSLADGVLVESAPQTVELRFNEPVSPLATRLIAPDGSATDLATTGGATVTIALPDLTAQGTYVLSYRVVSADGHPIGGALVFSVGAVTGAAAPPTTDPASRAALWLGKALLFTCLFFGIGGAAFQVLAPLAPPARRGALLLSLAGLAIAPLTLGLQGLDALALPLGALPSADVWAAGLATSYGLTVGAATLGFAVAVLALLRRGRRAAAGVVAAAIGALAIALSGHASAAAPQQLTRPMVVLHMAGLLFWIGALGPLAVLLRDDADAATAALANFSRAIPYAVAALVVSGVTLAVIQMGAPGPAWLSGYGVVLAIKLGLLIALFGLALWNRLGLTQPALKGDATARRQLRRAIGAEIVLVLVILALVAVWRFTPPPRALAAAPAPASTVTAEPLFLHMMDDEMMVMATLTPGRAGPVEMALDITDFEGLPVAVEAVTVTSAAPALGIEPIRREATPTEGGWRVADLTLPVAGAWVIAVDVRVSRFVLRKFETEIELP